MMRSLSHPAIWMRQEFEPKLSDAFPEMRDKGIRVAIKGTPGCEILPELAKSSSDLVVIKKRYSAFYNVKLDEILADLVPDGVVLAGVNTHALYSHYRC
jgi:nicotinamidase-related amidase